MRLFTQRNRYISFQVKKIRGLHIREVIVRIFNYFVCKFETLVFNFQVF